MDLMFQKNSNLKSIASEQFEEPSVLYNVVEYFSKWKKIDEIDHDKIVFWAKFSNCDYNDPKFSSDSGSVILLIGRRVGLQIYQLKTDGHVILLFSLASEPIQTASMLPSPMISSDDFSNQRPLLALATGNTTRFYSVCSGKCVKDVEYKESCLDISATERMILFAFQTHLDLVCPSKLVPLCRLINCTAGSDPHSSVAYCLSDYWLAFADACLTRDMLSAGGDLSEPSSVPYAVTLMSVKKMVVTSLGSGDVAKELVYDEQQSGVITVLDLDRLVYWVSQTRSTELDCHLHTKLVVAHFTAHLWTSVAKMVFDSTGTLLLTACSQGLFCHLFRIAPHPTCSKQTAVLHLYRLKRGDTPCSIVSMAISRDGRLASASSNHGTIHVWPISSYGGSLCVRTHCQKHVVNRLSRLERSAGLQEYQITRPRAASMGLMFENLPNHAYHPLCPRLLPMPIPCTINSYVQLKPISYVPVTDHPVVLISQFPRGEYSTPEEQFIRSEAILICSFDGRLFQYLLKHRPDMHQLSARTELDGPFVIEKQAVLQWKLPLDEVINCIDKEGVRRRQTNPHSYVSVLMKSKSQSALLPSVIPENLSQSFQSDQYTPKCWYSHIEISSQISSTSNIRRQDKFSISTYQTKELTEARLEVLQKSPSISSDMSAQSAQSETDTTDMLKGYRSSQPVKVPCSEQRIQICNSFCGSSISDSLGGSVDNMCSVLQHAILDEDDCTEPPQDIIDDSKTGYIESMTRDIGQVRLRRISGPCFADNNRGLGFSSPLEEDILEELDIPESPCMKQFKRCDKKKGRKN